MNVINSANVTVYGDEFGFYAAGITRRLPCDRATFTATKYFNPSAIPYGNCMGILPAGATEDNTGGAIKVAQLSLPGQGFIWVAFADYDTLVTACNACCNS